MMLSCYSMRSKNSNLSTLLTTTSFSSLTFDSCLDNFLENASVIKQPLGHEAYGVQRPRFEPIDYVETLRSVYSLWNPPATITYTAKHRRCKSSKCVTAFMLSVKKMGWVLPSRKWFFSYYSYLLNLIYETSKILLYMSRKSGNDGASHVNVRLTIYF